MTFVFLTFVLLGAFSNYERFVAEKKLLMQMIDMAIQI